jgi:hypothetical protein
LRVCWCPALSLTRRRVCSLQLMLVLASAVIHGTDFRGSCDHIILSQDLGLPFRRLLGLAGLRWKYSTHPPNGSPHGMTAVWMCNCHAALIEVTSPRVSLLCFMSAFSRKPYINSPETIRFSKCLQVSMETLFCNYLVSRNQSLRGNVSTCSFRRKSPCITICGYHAFQYSVQLSVT